MSIASHVFPTSLQQCRWKRDRRTRGNTLEEWQITKGDQAEWSGEGDQLGSIYGRRWNAQQWTDQPIFGWSLHPVPSVATKSHSSMHSTLHSLEKTGTAGKWYWKSFIVYRVPAGGRTSVFCVGMQTGRAKDRPCFRLISYGYVLLKNVFLLYYFSTVCANHYVCSYYCVCTCNCSSLIFGSYCTVYIGCNTKDDLEHISSLFYWKVNSSEFLDFFFVFYCWLFPFVFILFFNCFFHTNNHHRNTIF